MSGFLVRLRLVLCALSGARPRKGKAKIGRRSLSLSALGTEIDGIKGNSAFQWPRNTIGVLLAKEKNYECSFQ